MPDMHTRSSGAAPAAPGNSDSVTSSISAWRLAAGRRLWRASLAVVVVAAASSLAVPDARAADYVVSDETELRDAIDTINNTNDPNGVIILDANITLLDNTPLPAVNQPVTVNTGTFTLSAAPNPNTNAPNPAANGFNLIFGAGTTITVQGTLKGGDTASGLNAARAGAGLSLTNGSLTNNGTLVGGTGGAPTGVGNNGQGGFGALLNGGVHVNNGTISGGVGGIQPDGDQIGGVGLELTNATMTNNGTIQSGISVNASGGSAVVLEDNSTLINDNLVEARTTGVITIGGRAVIISGPNVRIENSGTIRGGDATGTQGGEAIINFPGSSTITVINSGTLEAGANGSGNAVNFNAGGGGNAVRTLELRAGSTIIGNVVGNVAGVNDFLVLGGDGDDTFDVSLIGAAEQYQNFNIFEKRGASTWTIEGVGDGQAAPWDIYEGTMLMSAGSDLGDGAVDIFGGILAGVGTVGPTTNHGPSVDNPGGAIAPGIPGENNGLGTLTVDGTYTGNGGALLIESVLGDDDSPTDLLVITGNSVMNPDGTTQVFVTNLGGSGAPTFNGIKIVDVEGADSTGLFDLANGDFVVNGNDAIIAGAFAYSLFQNGVEDPLDGDWYLRSIGFAPTTAAYEAMPGVLLGLMELPTLQQRVGDRIYGLAGGGGADLPTVEEQAVEAQGYSGARNLWTRIEGAHSHVEGDSTTDASYDATRWLVQLGLDGQFVDNGAGVVIGGINLQYAHADADISSASGDGDVSGDSFGVGATLTWYGDSGIYVDGQAAVAYQLADVSSDIVGDLVDDNDGWGYALSIEAGRKVGLGGNWGITPQAQLSYSSIDFDDFTDPFGADIALDSGDSLVGRLGVSLDYDAIGNGSRGHLYTIANLTYEFLDGTSVDVSGTAFEFDPEAFGGELGIGGTYEWAGGRYAIHGEALGQTDFGDGYGFKGTAGAEMRF